MRVPLQAALSAHSGELRPRTWVLGHEEGPEECRTPCPQDGAIQYPPDSEQKQSKRPFQPEIKALRDLQEQRPEYPAGNHAGRVGADRRGQCGRG